MKTGGAATMRATIRDATSYELFALAELAPVLDEGTASQTVCDLRGGGGGGLASLRIFESLGAPHAERVRDRLRPLGCGAAWKVLDVIVESALDAMRPGERWTIERKAKDCATATCPPLSDGHEVWERVCGTYAGLVEQRHSLVHRSFTVAPGTGALCAMVDRKQKPVLDVTGDEQLSLMRVAQRAASAVIGGTLPTRYRDDLLHHLDGLQRHHRLPVLGAESFKSVVLVIANALPGPNGWSVEPSALLASARNIYRGAKYFDLELHFPELGVAPLRGALEEMPPGVHAVDPSSPPSWLPQVEE